ncbi:substrate-binding domain-containing protein [Compostibacter hankyongensis]|uniref:Substrate-binding domain-containing protein n=2 Tax=Compostibacter hankyongensis TaxID=1007089 RepID=A0ABP8FZ05_9BACT
MIFLRYAKTIHKKMKRVSLKDIAREAGVSTTTVSFVLNGKAREKRISEAVCQRVQELVCALKYKPNQVARGLRTGQTKTIGLMVEDISNNFFATLARIIEDEADRHGYKVLYCSTENNTEKAKELLQMLHHRQIDGYIITPTNGIEEEIRELLQHKRPMVLIDRYFPEIPTNYVMVDNFRGAYMATEYLIKSGYRKIGIVTLASEQVQMQDRLEGFMAAMHQYKLPVRKYDLKKIPFEQQREKTVQEIVRFLRPATRPEAVFFTTNYLGIYGLEAIKQLGIPVPEELAVISYDDHDLFRLHNPSITCMAQPIAEIGRQVVQVLVREMEEQNGNGNGNGNVNVNQLVLPASLVVRSSCALQEWVI